MKIVVIGGSGLIGSKLVEKLREDGHETLSASPESGVDTLTGEGLAEALDGAQVVVDVTNAPIWDDAAVLDFFRTSSRNILAAEAAAGVNHHVVLSIVGTDRLQDSGYFRAKLAQEEAVKAATVPYTILRATQFFEFIGRIADSSTDGETVRLPPVLIHPGAADDVASVLAEVALKRTRERHRRAGGPGTVPPRPTRPTRPKHKPRPARGGGRHPGTLLRRRARRPVPHARQQPTHNPDPFRGLAQPVHGQATAPADPREVLVKPTIVLVHAAFTTCRPRNGGRHD